MARFLVDSNVILDVVTEDPRWLDWSRRTIDQYAEDHVLAIDPVIYAEVSVGFERIEELDQALPGEMFERRAIPWEAAFMAGKCFVKYRRRGGARLAPLPDFFIGAHAAVEGLALITRDPTRYRAYFPRLGLVAP